MKVYRALHSFLSLALHGGIYGARYCRRSAWKGGTCIFVLSHLNHITVNTETNSSDPDTEVCAIELQYESSHICIFSVYGAPSGNVTHFLYKMEKILKSLYSIKAEFIICGDSSIDYLTDNYRKN
jgi:exonuclease III